jgi:hypothetical protein
VDQIKRNDKLYRGLPEQQVDHGNVCEGICFSFASGSMWEASGMESSF